MEILQTFSQLKSFYLCLFSKTLSQFIPLGVKHLALNLKPPIIILTDTDLSKILIFNNKSSALMAVLTALTAHQHKAITVQAWW
ncbi:TPA: hypothetical protein RJ191_000674 [Mannheimia haemolytica]|nr:hypothetical protein [Mannheimia haemolytica]